ncbi:Smr/MutS family protein, partial [Citrobacter freundii]|nr:Smr/MutS family protein [Citrobacter freundii]
MNLDDASLFLDAMGDVQPLKSHSDVHWQPMRNLRTPARIDTLQLDNFLSTGFLDIVPLSVPLEFRREGLQNGVTDKLRNGKYPQQASLNLIRQPVETCRQMLFSFILQAQQEGLRNVLVIHGKGRDDNSHANIIR